MGPNELNMASTAIILGGFIVTVGLIVVAAFVKRMCLK